MSAMRRSREEETSEEEENEKRQWEEKVGEVAVRGVVAEEGKAETKAKKRRKTPKVSGQRGVYGRGQQGRRGARFGPWPGQTSERRAATEPGTAPIRPRPEGASSSSSSTRAKVEERVEAGKSSGAPGQSSQLGTRTVLPTRVSESLVERWEPAVVEFERGNGEREMIQGVVLRPGPPSRGPTQRGLGKLRPVIEADAESETGGWLRYHGRIPMKWREYAVTANGDKRISPTRGGTSHAAVPPMRREPFLRKRSRRRGRRTISQWGVVCCPGKSSLMEAGGMFRSRSRIELRARRTRQEEGSRDFGVPELHVLGQ